MGRADIESEGVKTLVHVRDEQTRVCNLAEVIAGQLDTRIFGGKKNVATDEIRREVAARRGLVDRVNLVLVEYLNFGMAPGL